MTPFSSPACDRGTEPGELHYLLCMCHLPSLRSKQLMDEQEDRPERGYSSTVNVTTATIADVCGATSLFNIRQATRWFWNSSVLTNGVDLLWLNFPKWWRDCGPSYLRSGQNRPTMRMGSISAGLRASRYHLRHSVAPKPNTKQQKESG